MHKTDSKMARVVERNIEALLEKQRQTEQAKTTEERVADAITRFAGSMRFVYAHLGIYGLWVVINSRLLPIKPFDPSFVMLATLASVEAIFLSTFILISQNRMQAQADKRADLNLQVSLLAEHEITNLITLVRKMAERMDIEEARNEALTELEQDVHPEEVLDELESCKHSMHD